MKLSVLAPIEATLSRILKAFLVTRAGRKDSDKAVLSVCLSVCVCVSDCVLGVFVCVCCCYVCVFLIICT